MIEIEKPQIECIETPSDVAYGKYVVEPLERGYGTTLGNALRRILLSSLPGTAATSIKIAGIQHEFSTIPGVKEDVTDIVLNAVSYTHLDGSGRHQGHPCKVPALQQPRKCGCSDLRRPEVSERPRGGCQDPRQERGRNSGLRRGEQWQI